MLTAAPPAVYYATSAVVLGTIAIATGKRLWELSEGGAAMADMVDARRIERNTQDAGERRLLNIVEEMALASGIAAPVLYVMDEQRSINGRERTRSPSGPSGG